MLPPAVFGPQDRRWSPPPEVKEEEEETHVAPPDIIEGCCQEEALLALLFPGAAEVRLLLEGARETRADKDLKGQQSGKGQQCGRVSSVEH